MFNDTTNISDDAVAFSIIKDGGSVPMDLSGLVGPMEIPGVSGASFLVPHGMPPSTTDREMHQFRFPVQRFREFIANFRNGPFQERNYEVVMTASQSSQVREPNRNYQFIPWQPVMKCRIFMPRNPANEHIVKALIDAFKSDDEAANIPAVKEYLERYPDDRQPIVELLGSIAGGSTRYEAIGRYKGEDEICQITEYITFDPEVSGVGREQFWALALDVITHLIARRFAEHLGFEREVWMEVQFSGHTYLFRFVQGSLIQEAA
jgi:hypothetical protein